MAPAPTHHPSQPSTWTPLFSRYASTRLKIFYFLESFSHVLSPLLSPIARYASGALHTLSVTFRIIYLNFSRLICLSRQYGFNLPFTKSITANSSIPYSCLPRYADSTWDSAPNSVLSPLETSSTPLPSTPLLPPGGPATFPAGAYPAVPSVTAPLAAPDGGPVAGPSPAGATTVVGA